MIKLLNKWTFTAYIIFKMLSRISKIFIKVTEILNINVYLRAENHFLAALVNGVLAPSFR